MKIYWSKSNWNGISFWKYFKMKFSRRKSFQRPAANFLHWRIIKIARINEFTTSKFFTFNDFFHFPGLNWSLKDVKHTILSLQKPLIFNKYFCSTHTLLELGNSLKMHIFILALSEIPTSLKQNIYLDEWNRCSKTGKHNNILWFQRTFSTLGRQILFILVIAVFNTHVTAFTGPSRKSNLASQTK